MSRENINTVQTVEGTESFKTAHDLIADANQLLDRYAAEARTRIGERVAQLAVLNESDRRSIESLLSAGQFALAEDLVERIESGDPLTTAEPPRVEQAFEAFLQRADALAAWLSSRRTAMRELGDGSLDILLELLPSNAAQAPDMGKLAGAWADCQREPRNNLQAALLGLLSALGFTDPAFRAFATPTAKVTEASFQLSVRALRDRDTAILPRFGSETDGHYRLVCLWRKREVSNIVEALAATRNGSHATIVLFFAPLSNDERRELAALSARDKPSSAIVIDEVLALHLAMVPAGRLAALFACTLPFTDLRPWADMGTPAPEMFFGRGRELRAVREISGDYTHLIYGGRQLGKTAVLRQVERTMSGQQGVIVRYMSIADLGLSQPVAELWPRLAETLSEAGVPCMKSASERDLRNAIKAWLDAQPSRRILVLFDEADAFFTADRAEKFPVTALVRDMVEDTNRRFKPVFAGLHNVQRLARDPNSPLAHLGMPLVVGPMLRGEDRREAEELVRWPFAALGYRMNEAIVTRILTFANYYPSLIQIVCQRLLRGLRKQNTASGPPWDVRMEAVERVLDTEEVRAEALKRFAITLDLDQRYKLLTLLVALFSLDDPRALARGIDRSTLRGLAADAWPAGFPPTVNDDAFDAVLDEMVGLGLLRRVGAASYALRSANLAHLIGTKPVIEAQIDAYRDRPAEKVDDPLDMRRSVEERPGLLTFRQESALLDPKRGGAIILAGTGLARLDGWEAAIKMACQNARTAGGQGSLARPRVLGAPYTLENFRALLHEAGQSASGAPMLCVVPATVAWDADWVREASRSTLTRARGTPLSRVLFIADAVRAWEWVADPGRAGIVGNAEAEFTVRELTASPWSSTEVDLWANEVSLGMARDTILEATAGWDRLLTRLQHAAAQVRSWSVTALKEYLLQKGPDDHPLSDIMRLTNGARVLRAMADCADMRVEGEIVGEEMVAVAADLPLDVVASALRWAELTGLAVRGNYGFVVSPVVAFALRNVPYPAS